MTSICLDFGNTRLKAAVFNDDKFVESIVLDDDSDASLLRLLERVKPERSILSSVINHNTHIEKILAEHTAFHKLSHLTKINFTTPVGKPETIGADRLALMAAAAHFYPGKNNLVIALGSCVTYNFLNQNAQFLGGSISPGMDMRFKSMHDMTAKLPLVSADFNFPLIGYDTKTNLQSGVILGMINEIEGFIDKYHQHFGNFNVVLTGGNSAYFASQLKYKIFADHNFLFKGLYALSETNNCRT
ncbi:MAG: type III pantothenate kinase [Chitinophagaceae bacterium]|nr:MAG: type III pantothenate kinase [Chitinophagaceae bacterium]